MTRKGYCLELGTEEYGMVFELQQQINQARRNGTIPDTVIFLEHQACFTVGRKGGLDHILVSDKGLEKEGIRVYESDRGGDITYHGPGQLVCYPILDLKGYERDVHLYARQIEEMLIGTLASFGITAGRKEEYPGVWVGNSKIGAEGIAIQNWVTMHGVSLNVCPDLHHFSFIVPCGISSLGVISMEKILDYQLDIALVRQEMRKQFCKIFNIALEDISLEKIKEIINNAQS